MTITTNSIISQVNHLSISDAKKNPRQPNSSSCLPDVIELSLRGVSITITRDTLVNYTDFHSYLKW